MTRHHALALALVACASRPTRSPPPAPPAMASASARLGTFGRAVPYRIVAMPEDGRWSILCEARDDTFADDGKLAVWYSHHGDEDGDELRPYLYDLDGKSVPIDGFVDADPTGRWLAIAEADELVLLDTARWQRRVVVGDLPHYSYERGRRGVRFDPTSTRVFYFRDDALIVRELASGRETEVAPARAKVWSARWSLDGSWLHYTTLDRDSNGDGLVVGHDSSARAIYMGRACGHAFGDPAHDSRPPSAPADVPTSRLWRVRDGATAVAEAAVADDTIVTREATGALFMTSPGGPARELAPASCRGEILATYARSRTVLVLCRHAPDAARVWWAGGTQRVDLLGTDDPRGYAETTGGRYVWLAIDSAIVDMRDGTIVARGDAVRSLWMADERIVYLEGEQTLRVRTPAATTELVVAEPGDWHVAPPYAVHGTTRIHLATRATTEVPGRVQRVRSDGAVLLDGGPQPGTDRIGPNVGPLRWVMP